MKIFYTALVMVSVVILFMLPISEAVYDFRTDIKSDSYFYPTGIAETSANVTLRESVYRGDTTTVTIASDLHTDIPVLVNYNTANRRLDMDGLTVSSNRTVTVSYDYDSLNGWDSINGIVDKLPWIWLLMVILFAPASLVSLWVKRE